MEQNLGIQKPSGELR